MDHLESLKTVATFGLLSDHVQDRVDQLGSFSVMSLGPIVSGSGLSEHEVIRSEQLAVRAGSHGVHSAGLQVHQHSSRHVSASRCLVVIHVDSFQLQITVSGVSAGRVDPVFVTDHLPKLGADLVTTLSSLHVNNFSHSLRYTFIIIQIDSSIYTTRKR